MSLFDVYPIYDITPVKALGAKVWDDMGREYLDFYGGHGVISAGHSHPAYVKAITDQAARIGFYSNSIRNPLQEALGAKLTQFSGYPDYSLFLCNSGAEANENALKLASFHTGKKKVIAFNKSFHGRTSAAVAATDNPSIAAPINAGHEVVFLPLNDIGALTGELSKGDACAVIIEGIQGVGGLDEGTTPFFQAMADACSYHNVVLILDEIQSGYGRSGKFFAHQHHGIQPDIISVAKGMGNGFPIGGILIAPKFKASHGLLGTTFGGNHLASAAALSVLAIIENENLIANVNEVGSYFRELAAQLPEVKNVKGRGLMLGLEFDFDVTELRKKLICNEYIFTGNASQKNLLRILPPLSITKEDTDRFFTGLKKVVQIIAVDAVA
jgi:acetylornithine/N-succinyldiaminopimelate aminotransferase